MGGGRCQIEASRLGNSGNGFAVIGHEMKRLSEEISHTNTLVENLSDNLGKLLPNIATMIESTAARTDMFSDSIVELISDVRNSSAEMQGDMEMLLSGNADSLATIIEESNEALSHLQFQDTVAQGLLRIDTAVKELVIVVGTLGGEDMGVAEVAEVQHEEIGGEKQVSPDAAGEVMLF